MGRVISVAMQFRDAFSRPCSNTIRQLRVMGRTAQQTGKSIQNAGKSISKVGSSLTKSVTMPIAGVAAASIKTAADFESAMTEVKVVAGATQSEFAKLQEEAQRLGQTTKFSAIESAEAMQYMAQAGWDTKAILEGTEGVMNAAASSGEELGAVANILAKNITAFGDTAADATRYADVLAASAAVSAADVNYLGEGFKYAASTAGAMGYTVEDMSLALAAMSQSGIEAGTAGAALRNIISNLAKPTDSQAKVIKKLGLSLTDSSGQTKSFATVMNDLRDAFSGMSEKEAAAAASTLAGKQSMASLLALVNTSDKDFKTFSDAIYNSTGTAKQMADEMQNNLNGQITLLKSAAEGAAITIGNKLLPTIKDITGKVQEAANWFNGLSDSQFNFIIKAAGIAAAIGPVILIIGKLVTAVGGAVTMFGNITMAIANAGGILPLLTSPAAIVVGVITALAVAAVLVIKNWDKIKPVLQKVGTYLKATLGPIFLQISQTIKKHAIPIFNKIRQTINDLIPVVKAGLKSAIAAAIPIIKKLMDAFKATAPYIKDIFATAIDILGVAIKNISAIVTAVAPVVKKVFAEAVKELGPIFEKVATVINKTIIPLFKKVLVSAFKIVSKQFKALGVVFKTVSGWITKGVTVAAKFVNKNFNTIKKVVTTVMKVITTPVRVAFTTISSVIKAHVSSIGGIIDGLTKTFTGVANFVSGVFTGNWKKAWEGVRDVFSGVWETFANVVKIPINAVINIINEATAAISKACSIKVPDWVPGIGGQDFSLTIPQIPNLAHGTQDWKGGLVQVHERGGEIIDLPKGSRVYPHDESVKMASKQGTTISITFNKLADKIDVNKEEDIDELVDKFAKKLKLVYDNM